MNVVRLSRQNINLIKFFNIQRCSTIVPRLTSMQFPEISRRIDTNPNIFSAKKNFFSSGSRDFVAAGLLDLNSFENVCSETLEQLSDYFEAIVELEPNLPNSDITFSDGVLTVKLGKHGTFVINRQTPNRQIWLSSPISGPKRYDFMPIKNKINEGYWIYKHDGVTLHELLQKELSTIFTVDINLFDLPHSKRC